MDYTPSRFVRKTLMPDERCIKDARFSWIYSFNAFVILIICALLGYAAHLAVYRVLGFYTWHPVFIGLGIGGWMFIAMMMKKWTTEIILTSARLIYKRGFFAVKVEEVDIEQLASDTVEQTLWGRMFDYGEIHVRCIEADDIILPAIDQPYEFRNALEQQKHIYRDTYMKIERLRHHGDEAKDK